MNILSGLIGALLLWTGGRFVARRRTAALERRYTLAGEYLSWYEDPQPDGSAPVRKAIALLARDGNAISGTTTNLDDKRTWQLRLSLHANRYLVGTYSSEQPTDPGLGAVFLEITAPGCMEGRWVGFDPATRAIQSGAYRFSRTVPVRITGLPKEDAGLALALLSRGLGEQYITEPDLSRYLSTPDARAFAATDPETGRLVGVALAEIIPLEALGNGTARIRAALNQPHLSSVGLLRSVTVLDGWRNRGIATRLAKHTTTWLDGRKPPLEISLAWVKPNGSCPAAGILESAGFEAATTLDSFWTEDSTSRGYDCPVCGNPCRCAAKLYHRLPSPVVG